MNMCDRAPQIKTKKCPRSQKDFSTKLISSKHRQNERDSGVGLQGKLQEFFDGHYPVSRRSSICSSGCTSMATTPSPNSTVSSAYCSAASSCCDSDASSHRKSDMTTQSQVYSAINDNFSRVPYHPDVNAIPYSFVPVESKIGASAGVATLNPSQNRNRAISSGSTKSERLSASEDARRLEDPVTNKVFEKRRLLGKGGFARVYEVVQLDQSETAITTESLCAAKIIEKSRISRPQQREKVDLEVELMAEARGHPNVVSYIGSFEDENCVCILMELCNKKSLAQYLRRKQHLSELEVCDILRQIVSGLSHLHEKGIIHRDLKLGNILLCDDMQVKIGDFGLASRIEWGRKKTICGTPNFIAPEVLQRQGHGPEADIWALGCLLYTLLVGKPPFETTCLRETYRCILKNSYRIPATVSSEAADLVSWMLRHKPKSRPAVSEILSHPFFKKHSNHLQPMSVQVTPKVELSNAYNDKPTASVLSEEKPLIQVTTKVENISPNDADHPTDERCTDSVKAKEVKSPIKCLASRLQKKLSKVSSPGKRVRAAAASLREGRKTSTTSKADCTDLNEKAPLRKTDSDQSSNSSSASIASGCKTWISKWVDYSNRYGFGYQLSSGRMCVLFNDGKHISMMPDGKIVEYASSESSKIIRFSIDTVPSCLAKYNAVLKNFSTYMDRNLRQNSGVTSSDQVHNDCRLLTWRRTDEYVAMYLSDGTLQVNFSQDHVKVNVSCLHKRSAMRVTVVDATRKSTTYERDQFIANADSTTSKRLSTVHRLFHSIFADVDCKTHPFCTLCNEVGLPVDSEDVMA